MTISSYDFRLPMSIEEEIQEYDNFVKNHLCKDSLYKTTDYYTDNDIQYDVSYMECQICGKKFWNKSMLEELKKINDHECGKDVIWLEKVAMYYDNTKPYGSRRRYKRTGAKYAVCSNCGKEISTM